MSDVQLHTIGHSNHSAEAFVALLRRHDIGLVVDVRSQPYSQWSPQFNRENLMRDLAAAGIGYRYMGDALGGRPADPGLYAPGGERPDYDRMAQAPAYLAGLERLLALAGEQRLAVMCSEGDHRQCHRQHLITETLLARRVTVLHIQPDGATVPGEATPRQLSLFG